MGIRKINTPKGTLLFGLLALSVLLFFMRHQWTSELPLLFRDFFSPLLKLGKSFDHSIRMSSASDDYVPKSEYDTLWKNYKNLSAQNEAVQKENLLLAGIRKRFGLSQVRLLPAKIMTMTRSQRQEIIVNQGVESGVETGQYVVSPEKNSVIGIVKEVSGSIARVQLLTDSAMGIEVRIRRESGRLDIPAQMFGNGRNGGRIGFIAKDADVRVGDAVYASPNKEKLPVPIVIGEISEVKANEQSPLLWDISVRPVDSPEQLNEVVILIPPKENKR